MDRIQKFRSDIGSLVSHTMNGKLQIILAILACITLPIIIYSNTLNVPFIFDDIPNIVENPDIKNIRNLKTRLIYKSDANIYNNQPTRPLTYLSLTLNYYFGGLNVFGYHLVNIALHILVTILIFSLTRKTFFYLSGFPKGPETLAESFSNFPFDQKMNEVVLPLAVALLFSVHPMNIDVVTHIIHRSGSLSTLFYLTSLLLFIKSFEGNKWLYPFSLLCFTFSFYSKQIAATLPAMILLFDYLFLSSCKAEKVVQKKYYHLPFWTLLVLMVAWNYFYLGNLGYMGETLPRYIYLLTQPWAILNYLRLLFVPMGQSIDHFLIPTVTIFEIRFILTIVLLSGIFISTYLFYKKKQSLSRLVLFSVLWFFITLTPTSSFFPINESMAEKRVYLPGWGFSIGLICLYLLIFKMNFQDTFDKSRGKKLIIILGIHILLLSAMTWNRNKDYQSPILLWKEVIKVYPHNARAYNNLGIAFSDKRNHDKALEYYQKAIQVEPNYAKAYNNLGNVFSIKEDYSKAFKYYQKAIQLDPNYAKAYNNLGNVFSDIQDYNEAIRYYQKAIELNPKYADPYYNLGKVYDELKEYGKAQKVFRKASDLNPDLKGTYNRLDVIDQRKLLTESQETHEQISNDHKSYNKWGTFYAKQKNYAKAIESYHKALEMNPNYAVAHYNMGNVYRDQNEYGRAVEFYRKAIKLNPDYALPHYNLGRIYSEQGKYTQALREYQKTQKLISDNIQVQEKIERLKKLLNNQ